MKLGLQGDTALVTASSSGLGKASAKALAREGANVVINGRDPDRLEEAVAELGEHAAPEATVRGEQGDITDPNVPAALIESTVDAFDGLDHLVTSAGGPPPGLLLETDDEDWYAAYDLLVMSVVRSVRAAAEHLRAGDGGSFVAITSRTVKEASESIVLSNSVRMAAIGLQKTLSRELAPEVRSNAVLPGAHETQRIRDLMSDAVERGEHEDYETALASREADIPVGSVGEPIDLGNTVAYLCSDAAKYVNGETILVDGGEHHSTL